MLDSVLFFEQTFCVLFFVNYFLKIQVALKSLVWCNLCRLIRRIWADSDSAGWTGWKVLTVHDE